MSIYKLQNDDILFNTLKTHPENEFFIYSGSIYYQNQNAISGANVDNLYGIPTGYVSLYQINVDRAASDVVYPFVTKGRDSLLNDPIFKNVSQDDYKKAQPGTTFTGSYDISASISREYFTASHLQVMEAANAAVINANRNKAVSDFQNAEEIRPLISASTLKSLEATLDYNAFQSPHFFYSASIQDGPQRDLDVVQSTLISIPSVFYGSKIKPGSVKLDYYVTGTYIGSLVDSKQNGELIQVSSSYASDRNGSVAGVVLYREGFILLTGSYDLSAQKHPVVGDPTSNAQWIHWGSSLNITGSDPISANKLSFEGTRYTHTNTYFTTLPKAQLNWSNNPTYLERPANAIEGLGFRTGSAFAIETEREIKNVVSSSFSNVSASFRKTTYVNQVNLFDDDGRLVAVGKLAKPIRKEEDRSYTIKLKVDI
jgi:hypothetical protein